MFKHIPQMIVGARQSGKTQELIRLIHSIQTGGPRYRVHIIVRSKKAQDQFLQMMGKRFDPSFMTITHKPDPSTVMSTTCVFVDDYDQMSPEQLGAISEICKNSLKMVVATTTMKDNSSLAI